MQLLVQHGYVSVVSVKRKNKQWGGRVPLVFGLKVKARKLLKNADLHSPTRLDWLTRPDHKNPSIEHQLMITDFLVALANEAATNEDYTFIPPWRMHSEMRTGQKLDLRASVSIDGTRVSIRIIPDAVCAIAFNRYGRRLTRIVFYEAYRNRNVVLTSRNIRRKSIVKTLFGYQELQRHKKTKRYSPHPFTVVVSCNITDRLQSIRSLGLNERLFRFFPSNTLTTHGNVIQEILNGSSVR